MSERTRIVLADDHPIVLGGLRHLIQAEQDLELIGEATTGHAALDLIRTTKPHVAVVDISMPGLNGIALTRRLVAECPAVRVLILTFHEDRAYVSQAKLAGVAGYVLKRSAAENLISAIHAVRAGGFYLDPALGEQAAGAKLARAGAPSSKGAAHQQVTDREGEVMRLVALGFSNKEIASQLAISVKSVETYKARAVEKLGLKTRAEIVRYASGQGWLADV